MSKNLFFLFLCFQSISLLGPAHGTSDKSGRISGYSAYAPLATAVGDAVKRGREDDVASAPRSEPIDQGRRYELANGVRSRRAMRDNEAQQLREWQAGAAAVTADEDTVDVVVTRMSEAERCAVGILFYRQHKRYIKFDNVNPVFFDCDRIPTGILVTYRSELYMQSIKYSEEDISRLHAAGQRKADCIRGANLSKEYVFPLELARDRYRANDGNSFDVVE